MWTLQRVTDQWHWRTLNGETAILETHFNWIKSLQRCTQWNYPLFAVQRLLYMYIPIFFLIYCRKKAARQQRWVIRYRKMLKTSNVLIESFKMKRKGADRFHHLNCGESKYYRILFHRFAAPVHGYVRVWSLQLSIRPFVSVESDKVHGSFWSINTRSELAFRKCDVFNKESDDMKFVLNQCE